MTLLLAQLMETAREAITAFGVVFLRVGAMMFLLPAFGELLIPVRVRLGLAIAFTAIVVPAVGAQVLPVAGTGGELLLLLGTEIVVGLTVGMTVRFFVMALQIAASMAAQATSLSRGGEDARRRPPRLRPEAGARRHHRQARRRGSPEAARPD